MTKETITLELDTERLRDAQALTSVVNQPTERVLAELLEEAIKMRRCPGTTFADGPVGRRPVILGTGIEVWSIIDAWKGGCQQDYRCLRETFHWLSDDQLRSALRYYELYPDEIDRRIERTQRAFEEFQHTYPHLVGPRE
jgi:uncharacterized protein (DUF433 family)